MKKPICIISVVIVSLTIIIAQQKDFPKLKGPYLGQKPPGMKPEIFAPGIISVDENFEHSAAVFSPDGKEVFWCTNVNGNTDKRVAGNLRGRLLLLKTSMSNVRFSLPTAANSILSTPVIPLKKAILIFTLLKEQKTAGPTRSRYRR